MLIRFSIALLITGWLSGCTTILGAYPSSFNVWGKPVDKNSNVSFFDMAGYHIKLHLMKIDLPPEELLRIQQDYADKTRSYYGPDSKEYAGRLGDISDAYGSLGNTIEQLKYAKEAYDISLKSLGEDHIHFAWACNRLSNVYYQLGDYDQALYYAVKATRVPGDLSSDSKLAQVGSHTNLANIYSSKKDYEQAALFHKKALSICEEETGETSRFSLVSRRNLAIAYLDNKKNIDSIDILHKGLELIDGQNTSTLEDLKSGYLLTMGRVYADQGDIAKGLMYTEQSLDILRSNPNTNKVLLADTSISAADLFDELGDDSGYVALTQGAVDHARIGLPKDSPRYAYYLGHLAMAYVAQNNLSKAKAVLEEIIAIYSKSLPTQSTELARSYSRYARIQQLMGDDLGAQESLNLASSIVHKYKISDPTLLVEVLKAMAWQQIRKEIIGAIESKTVKSDIHDRSRSLILQALDFVLASQENMTQSNYQISAYWLLKMWTGVSYNPELNIAIYKKIVNDHQRQKERLSSLSDKYLDKFIGGHFSDDYITLSSLLSQQGRDAESLQVLNMMKQHEFFEFIRRSDKENFLSAQVIEYNPDESAFVSELERIKKKLEITSNTIRSLQIKTITSPNPDDQAKLIIAKNEQEHLRSQVKSLLELPRKAKQRNTNKIKPSIDSKLAAALAASKSKAAHITYWISGDGFDRKLNYILSHSNRYQSGLITISPEQKVLLESIFPSIVADSNSNPKPVAKAAYDLLLGSISKKLEKDGIKTLIVSLHGALRYLPFAALYDGKDYLIERYNIAIYNNLSNDHLADHDSVEWDALAAGVTKPIGRFQALPGVRDEVESIVKQPGTNGVVPGVIRLDNDFTKDTLFDLTKQGFDALHIASHFVFSPGTEANSFLLLGDGSQISLGELRLQNLDLSNVNLVTLSACETGVSGGMSGDGKEIDGLSGVIQQKGAKAVIATLWPVADKSTAILMKNMYRRKLVEKLTKSEALRQAQLDLLHGRQLGSSTRDNIPSTDLPKSSYAHPYYWAPFFLTGNWQ